MSFENFFGLRILPGDETQRTHRLDAMGLLLLTAALLLTTYGIILQYPGGSLGSALCVLILGHHHPVDLAAFQSVFGWLTLTAGLALVAAGWLAVEQRRATQG